MHENIKMLVVWTQTISNETECPRVVNFPAGAPANLSQRTPSRHLEKDAAGGR